MGRLKCCVIAGVQVEQGRKNWQFKFALILCWWMNVMVCIIVWQIVSGGLINRWVRGRLVDKVPVPTKAKSEHTVMMGAVLLKPWSLQDTLWLLSMCVYILFHEVNELSAIVWSAKQLEIVYKRVLPHSWGWRTSDVVGTGGIWMHGKSNVWILIIFHYQIGFNLLPKHDLENLLFE